ncbi:hypothetical protein F442_07477 [Phytophthora nicotianae P10297]|uniref:RxLR effector protein n=1 Tax=Phytophthora nicotianae P10297 TaxID=1317064 RepID=W2ZJ76_PHYNI|nr:hypothetical protein F442_07477 [Phytophthora nicotianae P10297]
MRLLLWTLLATVGVFLSCCQAASGDSNKLVKCSLSDQLASCGRAVDIDFDYDKRFLRGESRTLQLKEDNRDEAEERGISQVAQKIADKTKQLGRKYGSASKRGTSRRSRQNSSADLRSCLMRANLMPKSRLNGAVSYGVAGGQHHLGSRDSLESMMIF